MRFKVQGEAYFEEILLENLPLEEEDKVNFGDCVIKEEKRITFSLRNNSTSSIKFQWGEHEDFTFIPRVGHLAAKAAKSITVVFLSSKAVSHKDLALLCETIQIRQNSEEYIDWDDSMTIRKFVTKTEFDWMERKKAEEKRRR